MRYVDPTGMDTLYFDHNGRYASDPRKGGRDVIFITDEKGNVHMKAYDAGTFKEYGRGKGGEDGYFYLSTNNEENSKSAFEFLATNTSVEWGNSKYKEGNSISNYLTTSHSEDGERGSSFLFVDKGLYRKGNALLRYDHSHPGNPDDYNFPSGMPDYKAGDPGRGDIGLLTYETNVAISRRQTIPVFRIYIPRRGYRRYHINSTYQEFKRMPNYYYEK